MAFPEDFKAVAVPALKAECVVQGRLVAMEIIDYDEAFDAVIALADKLGAWNLPENTLARLHDRMLAALTKAVADATPMVDTAKAELEPIRVRNPVGYYAKLASLCVRPDQMRWVFAAISPEYRASLRR